MCVCKYITILYLDELNYHHFKNGGTNNLGYDGYHIQIIWKSIVTLMKHEKNQANKTKYIAL